MTAEEQDVMHEEPRKNTWIGILTALIVLLCLPSSYLGLLWFIRLILNQDSVHGDLFIAITYMAYLVSAAFGPYIWGLALVLWLFQTRMGGRRAFKAISPIFLILALIGMLAEKSVMK